MLLYSEFCRFPQVNSQSRRGHGVNRRLFQRFYVGLLRLRYRHKAGGGVRNRLARLTHPVTIPVILAHHDQVFVTDSVGIPVCDPECVGDSKHLFVSVSHPISVVVGD